MNIEIKKSIKPVKYDEAITFMEERLMNINNNLAPYNKIIPCGISDRGITNLKNISNQKFDDIGEILIKKFISNLEDLNV